MQRLLGLACLFLFLTTGAASAASVSIDVGVNPSHIEIDIASRDPDYVDAQGNHKPGAAHHPFSVRVQATINCDVPTTKMPALALGISGSTNVTRTEKDETTGELNFDRYFFRVDEVNESMSWTRQQNGLKYVIDRTFVYEVTATAEPPHSIGDVTGESTLLAGLFSVTQEEVDQLRACAGGRDFESTEDFANLTIVAPAAPDLSNLGPVGGEGKEAPILPIGLVVVGLIAMRRWRA